MLSYLKQTQQIVLFIYRTYFLLLVFVDLLLILFYLAPKPFLSLVQQSLHLLQSLLFILPLRQKLLHPLQHDPLLLHVLLHDFALLLFGMRASGLNGARFPIDRSLADQYLLLSLFVMILNKLG